MWRQHHAEVQQYQQHYEHVEQLTKAVHAALTAAETMGYGQWSLPVQPEQEQQQEPLSDAPLPWRGAREGEAGSCDDGSTASETTRSNGSTRGSSLSQAASLMAEPSAASSDTLAPHLITGRHGAAVLSDGAQPATSAAQATPHAGMSLLQQQQQAVQTDEAWPTGPAWEVADYEEEVRQLSDQLQVGSGPTGLRLCLCVFVCSTLSVSCKCVRPDTSIPRLSELPSYCHLCLSFLLPCIALPCDVSQGLVSNNSSLKAVLQQRDAELAAQRERLEQQGHDLACCEDMLQVCTNTHDQGTNEPFFPWAQRSRLFLLLFTTGVLLWHLRSVTAGTQHGLLSCFKVCAMWRLCSLLLLCVLCPGVVVANRSCRSAWLPVRLLLLPVLLSTVMPCGPRARCRG